MPRNATRQRRELAEWAPGVNSPRSIDRGAHSYNLMVMEQLSYMNAPANLDAVFAALADPTLPDAAKERLRELFGELAEGA